MDTFGKRASDALAAAGERLAETAEDVAVKAHLIKPRRLSTGKKIANAVFSTTIVAAAAVGGSLATDTDSAWYKALTKPSWQPPPVAFPIAWTSLYAATAVGSTLALNRLDRDQETKASRRYRCALVVNMALNGAWPALFFQNRDLRVATMGAGALAVSSTCLARRAGKATPVAGAMLVPYAVWTTFATVLTATIAKENS